MFFISDARLQATGSRRLAKVEARKKCGGYKKPSGSVGGIVLDC
jgi:hypothetical protein